MPESEPWPGAFVRRHWGWMFVIAGYALFIAGVKASNWHTESRRVPSAELWTPADTLVGGRRIVPVEWDTVRVLVGASGAEIHEPREVAATTQGYVVSDGRTRLVAISPAGDILWSYGRPRQSVREVARYSAVRATTAGAVVALDQLDASVVQFDERGRVTGRTPVPALATASGPRLPDDVVPLANRRYALLYPDADSGIAVLDANGRSHGWIALPWSGYAQLHPLARQGKLTSDQAGSWALLFRYGNGWFSFRDTVTTGGAGRFARFTPFPTVRTVKSTNLLKRMSRAATTLVGRPPCSGCAATIADGRLYVIGHGAKGAASVVDVFDATSKEYRYSLPLPCAATAIAMKDSGLAVIAADQLGSRVLLLRARGAVNPFGAPVLRAARPLQATLGAGGDS